jgi:hypothetical protein
MNPHPRTYRCPNCDEMVNESMTTCRYCQVALDPAVGLMLAERQEMANRAYSDASYLRVVSAAIFVFLVGGIFQTIAYVGFFATLVISIVLLVRWQLNFSSLVTNDPDYFKAKRLRNVSVLLILLAFPAAVIYSPFLEEILHRVPDLFMR